MNAGAPPCKVYVVKEAAKEIEAREIMEKSGRGCDASDINDEETAPDYSDDEKERESKKKGKKGKKSGKSAADSGDKAQYARVKKGWGGDQKQAGSAALGYNPYLQQVRS